MRVVIAEDSVLLREGLERLLSENGLEVVGSCETAEDLLLKVRSYSPDVAIVDIRLPPTHNDEGLRAALEIRARHPSVGVLVLSQYVELGLAMKLLADSAEGAGYLLKDRISDVKEFIAAVRRVADGGSAIDPIIVSTLLSKRRSDDPLDELTPREREVLELMAEGRSNQGIADKLVITLRAVEKYVSSIFGKLGFPRAVATRAEFWRFCSTCAPESPVAARHQKPAPRNGKSPVFRSAVTAASVGWIPHGREERAMKTRVIQDEPDEPTIHEPSRRSGRTPAAPNLAARMARWSAHHRKKAIFGWLALRRACCSPSASSRP